MVNRAGVGLAVAGLLLLLCPGRAGATQAPKYHTHAELSTELNRLAAEHPRICTITSAGTSREGRAVWALRLALDGEVDPDARPALLLVANIDGDHLVGSEVALGVVAGLLRRAQEQDAEALDLLGDHTLYVIPRVNPDAAERFFAPVKLEQRRNLRPDDRDRDGAIDEDPPDDLNGDGMITMMRVFDPDEADMMADPTEPRLNVKPDRDKGERAAFKLYVEGIDQDRDGEYNEDPAGGVDLNMNFMHGYQEHADGAGPHQVSEPESLALLKFVLDHQNIALVLTYGRHDTLSAPPSGKGSYPSGSPKSIEEKDAGLYASLSERFKEITGLNEVPGDEPQGAFFEWAYAQFGVPSLATPLWTRPEAPKGEDGKGTEDEAKPAETGGAPGPQQQPPQEEAQAGAGLTPSGIGDISLETIDDLRAAAEARGFEVTDEMVAQISPMQVEGFARRMGIEVRRVKSKGGDGKAKSKEDAAWLAYSDDQRDGLGFVAWKKFDHPQLGQVEIGGWTPYFKANPPPEAIDAIVTGQIEFIADVGGRLPEVTLEEPRITRLASGLYEVTAAMVNQGYLPTGTAMAVRNRRARPYVVRLSIPNERILTGSRVNKVWSIPGSGGRESFRWIVAAEDGEEVKLTVYSEKFGRFDRTLWMRETEPAQGAAQ